MESVQNTTNKKTLIIVFSAVAVIIIGFGVYGLGKILGSNNPPPDNQNTDEYNVENYYKAPNITLTDISNTSVINTSEYVGEKAIILYFFYTRCGACALQTPRLDYVTGLYSIDDLQLIMVDLDWEYDDQTKYQTYVDTSGNENWTLTYDYYGLGFEPYSTGNVPHTVYINKGGYVTYSIVGVQWSDDIIPMVDETLLNLS